MTAVLQTGRGDETRHGPFRREVELGPHAISWLESFCEVVAEEVDAGHGIADLVGGVGGQTCFDIDQESLVIDELQLLLMQRCAAGAHVDELREWAPWGWRGLCRRALEPLVDRGLLVANGEVITSVVEPQNPFVEVVAVELKLRDWRRGLAQAGGYRLFANRTYLALPAGRVTAETCAEAERNLVGVLAINDRGDVEVAAECANREPLRPRMRDLVAQRALAGSAAPGTRRAGATIC